MTTAHKRWSLLLTTICAVFLILPPVHIQGEGTDSLAVITPENAQKVASFKFVSRGAISRMLLSPRGNLLAVSSTLGTWLYDTADFSKPPRLLANNHEINAVAFSPDGSLLASIDTPNPYLISGTECLPDTIDLWDVATGQLRLSIPTEVVHSNALAFSPDGSLLITASSYDTTIKVWNLKTGYLETTPNFEQQENVSTVFDLAFSPDGSTLATVGGDRIWLWNLKQKSRRSIGLSKNLLWAAKYRPDGKQLATLSSNGTLQLWDTATGRMTHIAMRADGYGQTLQYSSDGSRLLVGNSLFDVIAFREIETLPGSFSIFSKDGNSILSATASDITLVDLTSKQKRVVIDGFSGPIRDLSFQSNSTTVIATEGYTIRAWDTRRAALLRPIIVPEPELWAVAINSDLSISASIKWNTLHLWNVADGTMRSELITDVLDWDDQAFGSWPDHLDHLAFSPAGTSLAFASRYDKRIRLLDPTGQLIRVFSGSTGHVRGLAFNKDGGKLAALYGGNTVRVYDTQSGDILGTMPPLKSDEYMRYIHSFAFSPDGSKVALGEWKSLYWWTLPNNQFQASYSGTSGWVNSLAFSPDGRLLAAAVNTYFSNGHQCWGPLYRVIELWDTTTGKRLAVLSGHYSFITAVAFSPDGRMLVSGHADGAIQIWAVNPTVELF